VGGVKEVVMIRNMEAFLFGRYHYDLKNYFRNIILRFGSSRTLRRADRTIAVSGFAERQCTQVLKVDPSRVIRIYHGRDTRFTAEPGDQDGKMLADLGIVGGYIFTCGSILPYRRVEAIIEAFSAWTGAPDSQLVIAGSGNDRKYNNLVEELVRRSPVSSNILMVGYVSPAVMRVLYRCCSLFVTATDIEACPNMGIEALSSGCNILSSDNEPMPEIFEGAAVYFPSSDCSQLGKLLNDNFNKFGQTNEAAIERAQAFSWVKCADKTYKALTKWQ
jgi:glycosyltransferase involved in cell wall biosynthesis